MQKASRVGKWHVVLLEQSCRNFYPSSTYKAGSEIPRRIPLTKGKFALVDAEDYYRLAKFRWFANGPTKTKFYAIRRYGQKALKMHRVIMDAPEDLFVDHIDHNGLNNTRSNLRLCTRAQNNRNIPPAKGKSSRYKGVGWDKGTKKWRTKIRFNTKLHHIGYFENEIDAARAYDKKAAELFGEFACLNFPPEKLDRITG